MPFQTRNTTHRRQQRKRVIPPVTTSEEKRRYAVKPVDQKQPSVLPYIIGGALLGRIFSGANKEEHATVYKNVTDKFNPECKNIEKQLENCMKNNAQSQCGDLMKSFTDCFEKHYNK